MVGELDMTAKSSRLQYYYLMKKHLGMVYHIWYRDMGRWSNNEASSLETNTQKGDAAAVWKEEFGVA